MADLFLIRNNGTNVFDPPDNVRVKTDTGEFDDPNYLFYEGDLEITWDAVTPPTTTTVIVGGYYVEVYEYDASPTNLLRSEYLRRDHLHPTEADTREFTFTLAQNSFSDDNTGPYGDLIVRVYTIDPYKRLSSTYTEQRFIKKQLVPQNFAGVSALRGVKLTWDFDGDIDHISGGDYFEIYRSTTNDFGTSSKIGQTFSDSYVDNEVVAGATYYYWVNSVSLFNDVADNRVPTTTAGIDVDVDEVEITDISAAAVSALSSTASFTQNTDSDATINQSVVGENSWVAIYDETIFPADSVTGILSYSAFFEHPTLTGLGDDEDVAVVVYMALYDGDKLDMVAAQDETDFDGSGNNGTFTGGSSYAASDTITLSDGTTITVDAVSSGAVTQFTVSSVGTGATGPDAVMYQTATSGSGSGFTVTLDENNLSGSAPYHYFTAMDDFTAVAQGYKTSSLSQAPILWSKNLHVEFDVLMNPGNNYRFIVWATFNSSSGNVLISTEAKEQTLTRYLRET